MEVIDGVARAIYRFFQAAWQPYELSTQPTLIALAGCALCVALSWFLNRRIRIFQRRIERDTESKRASFGDSARLAGLVFLRLVVLAAIAAIVLVRPPVLVWLVLIGLIAWMLRRR
jgi:hypothetical protein